MLTKFQLSAGTLLTYLSHVEDHYRNVPYHNNVHAADVTQSIHSLLSIPALQVRIAHLVGTSLSLRSDPHDAASTVALHTELDDQCDQQVTVLGGSTPGHVHRRQVLSTTDRRLSLVYRDYVYVIQLSRVV